MRLRLLSFAFGVQYVEGSHGSGGESICGCFCSDSGFGFGFGLALGASESGMCG
jgi:hypothetical protein